VPSVRRLVWDLPAAEQAGVEGIEQSFYAFTIAPSADGLSLVGVVKQELAAGDRLFALSSVTGLDDWARVGEIFDGDPVTRNPLLRRSGTGYHMHYESAGVCYAAAATWPTFTPDGGNPLFSPAQATTALGVTVTSVWLNDYCVDDSGNYWFFGNYWDYAEPGVAGMWYSIGSSVTSLRDVQDAQILTVAGESLENVGGYNGSQTVFELNGRAYMCYSKEESDTAGSIVWATAQVGDWSAWTKVAQWPETVVRGPAGNWNNHFAWRPQVLKSVTPWRVPLTFGGKLWLAHSGKVSGGPSESGIVSCKY